MAAAATYLLRHHEPAVLAGGGAFPCRPGPALDRDQARKYVALLHGLGDVQVIPQKTRLVCVARVRFSGLEPRKHGFLASFALRRWLDSPRIVKTADYGPRWRAHYIRVGSEADLDDELITWLQEAHDTVGLQSDLRQARP